VPDPLQIIIETLVLVRAHACTFVRVSLLFCAHAINSRPPSSPCPVPPARNQTTTLRPRAHPAQCLQRALLQELYVTGVGHVTHCAMHLHRWGGGLMSHRQCHARARPARDRAMHMQGLYTSHNTPYTCTHAFRGHATVSRWRMGNPRTHAPAFRPCKCDETQHCTPGPSQQAATATSADMLG